MSKQITVKRFQSFFSFDDFTRHSAPGAAFDDQQSAVDYATTQLQHTRYQIAKVVDNRTQAETRITGA